MLIVTLIVSLAGNIELVDCRTCASGPTPMCSKHPSRILGWRAVIWGQTKCANGGLHRTGIPHLQRTATASSSPERERPDEQDYLSGLWRGCDFTACVPRSIPVVKNFFRAEALEV